MSKIDPLQIIEADALTGLRGLPDASVQVALTSPPFYLLRRYGTPATWPDGWEGELGHEPHPNGFVRHLLDCFDQVWRVLKDDGCLWVNLADTVLDPFAGSGTTGEVALELGLKAVLIEPAPMAQEALADRLGGTNLALAL